jgi:hypothetical protein
LGEAYHHCHEECGDGMWIARREDGVIDGFVSKVPASSVLACNERVVEISGRFVWRGDGRGYGTIVDLVSIEPR